LQKLNSHSSIGIDNLPEGIRSSNIFKSYHLDQLAQVAVIPDIDPAFEDDHLKQIIQYYSIDPEEMEKELHEYAKKLLEQGKINEAWQVLLVGG